MQTEQRTIGTIVTDLGPATLEAYKETRRRLLAAADRLTLGIHEREPARTDEEISYIRRLESDLSLVVGMISDCSYVIEWLETGRRPGNRRGIERRAAYQREIPTDPAKLPVVAIWPNALGEEEEESKPKLLRLQAALRGLTERERDCYILAHGQGYTHAEIAGMLQISKSSVGTYLVRAQRKIAANVGTHRRTSRVRTRERAAEGK